jgi:hypothetical protein
MLTIYTSTIYGYDGPDKLDITVKSGDSTFAPTWSMVTGYKSGLMSEEIYTELYKRMMYDSQRKNDAEWGLLLSSDRIVLCCYCKAGDFCHRTLLADMLVELGAEYKGEI